MRFVILVLLVFSLSYIAGLWLKDKNQVPEAENFINSDCNILKEPCRITDSDIEYTIQFEGEASPLKPFNVKFTTEKLQLDSIEIEFFMQDMDMGYNRYQLKNMDSAWQAQVILPVCSLGGKEWILRVKAYDKGSLHISQLKFTP